MGDARMNATDAEVAKRARIAFEMGRVRWAFVRALPVGLAAGVVGLCADTRAGPVATALLVLALVAVAGWKSRACIAGCVAGIALGALPFLTMRATGVLCNIGGQCVGWAQVCCALGGLVAGVAIGVFAGKARMAGDVVLGACAGAVLHIACGCPQAGAFEALGVVAGVVVGAAPLLALRRRAHA